MNISYYTIDDLRLGQDPKGVTGWRIRYFLSLDKALAQYRTMSPSGIKTLGVTDGVRTLELVRCHPLFPDDKEGEDVLAADYRNFPLWCKVPEVAAAEQKCIARLRLRYLMKKDRIVPIPKGKKLSKRFKGIRLRSCNPNDIRWIYVAGQGLVPPSVLKWHRPTLPLVLYYMVEGIAKNGAIVTLEVTPWEYEQLAYRTQEWFAQKLRGGKTS